MFTAFFHVKSDPSLSVLYREQLRTIHPCQGILASLFPSLRARAAHTCARQRGSSAEVCASNASRASILLALNGFCATFPLLFV